MAVAAGTAAAADDEDDDEEDEEDIACGASDAIAAAASAREASAEAITGLAFRLAIFLVPSDCKEALTASLRGKVTSFDKGRICSQPIVASMCKYMVLEYFVGEGIADESS